MHCICIYPIRFELPSWLPFGLGTSPARTARLNKCLMGVLECSLISNVKLCMCTIYTYISQSYFSCAALNRRAKNRERFNEEKTSTNVNNDEYF